MDAPFPLAWSFQLNSDDAVEHFTLFEPATCVSTWTGTDIILANQVYQSNRTCFAVRFVVVLLLNLLWSLKFGHFTILQPRWSAVNPITELGGTTEPFFFIPLNFR